MSAVPVWLIGRSVTSFTLTGVTVGSDGTLTDGITTAIQTISGKWVSIEFTSSPSTEEISASDSTRQNNVIIQENNSFRCETLLQKAKGAGEGANDVANPLASLCTAYDYLKISFTRGGKTWAGYFLRGEYTERYERGRCTASLTITMVDPNATNPSYT